MALVVSIRHGRSLASAGLIGNQRIRPALLAVDRPEGVFNDSDGGAGMAEVEVRVAARLEAVVGEGPVWLAEAPALWFVDIKDPAIYRFDPASRGLDRWAVPARIGCLVPRRGGGFLAALKTGLHTWDPEAGLAPLVDPEAALPDNRFNDGACDRRGRLFAGTMDDAERPIGAGNLYRFDRIGGDAVSLVGEVHLSNGLDWSPDDRTFYFADSLRRTVWAFDYDLGRGTIANRRVFARLAAATEAPDGLTVDAEGHVWIAVWGGHRLIRFAPDGREERTVPLPVPQPTSMAFGGPDLSTLYVTTARAGLDAAALAAAPLSGSLLELRPGVRGLPVTPFAG